MTRRRGCCPDCAAYGLPAWRRWALHSRLAPLVVRLPPPRRLARRRGWLDDIGHPAGGVTRARAGR